MRAMKEMLAGVTTALLVLIVAGFISNTRPTSSSARADTSGNIASIAIGDSDVSFQIEEASETLRLKIEVLSRLEPHETLQTRITMVDGQRFQMRLHDPDHDERIEGHTIVFERIDNVVLATASEAKRPTALASTANLFE